MKWLTPITARLLALWAIISFIASFLVIFLPSMFCWLVPDPKGQDLFIRIARWWMRAWLHLVGCPLKVKGTGHFRKGETLSASRSACVR